MKKLFNPVKTGNFLYLVYESADMKNMRDMSFVVNVWGWIHMHGPGVCWRISERFNAQNYRGILENVMLLPVLQIYPENNFTYQRDNCPVHNAE